MILLIGGESHVGKTLLAQKLVEKLHFPCLSLDLLKMGLIKGLPSCPFCAEDADDFISQKLWDIVAGIIETAQENEQDLIIEGCYLPPKQVAKLCSKNIIPYYLLFSEDYILTHFDAILQHENAIEQRKFPETRTASDFIAQNNRLYENCLQNNLPFYRMKKDYKTCFSEILSYLYNKVIVLSPYKNDDLNEITALFHDTVHTVCRKDYPAKELAAWSDGKPNLALWNTSLSGHDAFVARIGRKIVGFGDMDGGYFDRLYTSSAFQQIGIGTKIADLLEKRALEKGHHRLTVHASRTALPFFRKRGYQLVSAQKVSRHGVTIENFIMEKQQ